MSCIPYLQDVEYDMCCKCSHIFRKESKDDVECPVCQTGRYDGRGKPMQTFLYRPIMQYLRRIFAVKEIAEFMTWHANEGLTFGNPQTAPDHSPVLADLCQGEACRRVQASAPFNEDARHVMFVMAYDGVLMFKGDSKYSVWPIMLTPINLPPWMRNNLPITTMIGLVPGTRKKGVVPSMASLKLIISDELEYLGKYGCMIWDAFMGQIFNCRAVLVHMLSDTRGIEKVCGTLAVPGVHACPQCWQPGFRIPASGKTIYPGMYK
jgi:hypothetical protein